MKAQEFLERYANGERYFNGANLSGANFSGADLSGVDLREADLSEAAISEADFSGANFSGANLNLANLSGTDFSGANFNLANLSWANLRGANFSGANFSGANLIGTMGFYLLPVQDSRGYMFCHAVNTDRGWRIRAGCRYFSIKAALKHWGPEYKGDREQGDMYLHAVRWLEKRILRGEVRVAP